MNTFFLRATIGCVAMVAVAGSVQAADLSRRAPVATPIETPVSAYNWTGLYAGVHLGGDFARDKAKPGNYDVNGSTVFGGLTGGYNFQTGPWVLGAEGDIGYGKASKTKTTTYGSVKAEKDWGGTARVRAGYAIDNLLVYGTGGLAIANFKNTVDNGGIVKKKTEVKAGYAVGAGLEYAVAKNISVKGEYLYAGYGNQKVNGVKNELAEHIARVGVNYKF